MLERRSSGRVVAKASMCATQISGHGNVVVRSAEHHVTCRPSTLGLESVCGIMEGAVRWHFDEFCNTTWLRVTGEFAVSRIETSDQTREDGWCNRQPLARQPTHCMLDNPNPITTTNIHLTHRSGSLTSLFRKTH